MANSQTTFILLVVTLCFLSLSGLSHAADNNVFKVDGVVYCDTCRVQFVTRVSSSAEGATIRLECRNLTTGVETYKAEAVTDASGFYSLEVDGDYEDDICEIVLVKNSDPECSDIPTDAFSKQAAKISLTSNNGEATPVRNANPLGFMRKTPLPECPEVLKELDMDQASLPTF